MWQILFAKLTKKKKMYLEGQFHQFKTSYGYIAKLKPQGSVCKWPKSQGVIMQFSQIKIKSIEVFNIL